MAVTYPVGLSLPLVSGYSQSDAQKTAIVPTEAGSPRVELVSSDGYASYRVSWLFTELEFQVFEGWYKYELEFGSISFDMDLKLGGGLVSHELYFSKEYSAALIGKKWRVSASLWAIRVIESKPPASPQFFYLMDELAGSTQLVSTVNAGVPLNILSNAATTSFGVVSLLKSGQGTSVSFNSPFRPNNAGNNATDSFENGISFEFIIRPFGIQTAVNHSGEIVFVSWCDYTGNGRMFDLSWNNYANTASTDLFPSLVLFGINGAGADYDPDEYAANVIAEVRGTTPIDRGNLSNNGFTYHLVIVIKVSTETAELWLNGQLVGSAAIPNTWWDRSGIKDDLRLPFNSTNGYGLGIGRNPNILDVDSDGGGIYDELGIYYRELSQTEIVEAFNRVDLNGGS